MALVHRIKRILGNKLEDLKPADYVTLGHWNMIREEALRKKSTRELLSIKNRCYGYVRDGVKYSEGIDIHTGFTIEEVKDVLRYRKHID